MQIVRVKNIVFRRIGICPRQGGPQKMGDI